MLKNPVRAGHAIRSALGVLALVVGGAVGAQTASPVDVANAWVRTAVPGQKATGGFMALTARENLTLVGVRSPVAGVAEVHEMKMDGDVMRMRALPAGLELPAGRTVELKPGGYHVMLLDLKQPLPKGSAVPLTLVLRNARGTESRVELQVPVGLAAPGAAAPGDGHKH
ncbi:MAG TPA: copper chaperone PCu(A)C [Burkholderiaceae bacterium]